MTHTVHPHEPETGRLPGDRRGERVTLVDQLVSAALWGVGAGWMTTVMGALMAVQTLVRPERVEPLSRLYCRGQIALTGSRWRAEVHPDVDPKGVYMFAQNHSNHFDHVAFYPATPHFKQGLELETHFDYPVYGWFMKQRGTVPVPADPGGRRERVREGMRAEVARGRSLLVFPEGTRTLDGRVGPFKTGVFQAARDLELPVVPVSVTGMYDVMRKGSWIIRPGHTITVHVHAPIATKGVTDEELPAFAEHVRSIVAGPVNAYFANAHRPGERT
ncbi:MAG: lysophospholipid acyltransferase family protein [Myxococcota bacterium]